jgi:hypothetical protein
MCKSLRGRWPLIACMRRRSSSFGCLPYSSLNSSHTLHKRNEVRQKPITTIYKCTVAIASVCLCPISPYPNGRDDSLKGKESEHAKNISLPHKLRSS